MTGSLGTFRFIAAQLPSLVEIEIKTEGPDKSQECDGHLNVSGLGSRHTLWYICDTILCATRSTVVDTYCISRFWFMSDLLCFCS